MRGKFITIEGTEGAGKSTALAHIQHFLADAARPVISTREPGGTELGEEIRQVLLHPKSPDTMAPLAELLLMFASRAQLIEQFIKPALSAGTWVVSDRYVDASFAYQGGGRQMDKDAIATLDRLVVNDLYPDLTLLMDVPAELGQARAFSRGQEKDRIEQEKMDFFTRVRQAYLARAEQDPDRIKVIDASKPLAEVNAQIDAILTAFLARHPT